MTLVADVLAANTALYTAVESADFDLMEAVWLDGPDADTIACVHPGWAPLSGRAEVLRSWAAIMASATYVQFILTDVEVRISHDVAVVTCVENILSAPSTAATAFADAVDNLFAGTRVAATNVFRRTPSGWRLWVHHGSAVVRAEEGVFRRRAEEGDP